MAPVVAFEPLGNVVLGLAAAVIALAILILLQRSLALFTSSRSKRRLPILTRLVYDAVQNTPLDVTPLAGLSRFDRRLVRSILLDLALDLRGDTGDAISELYRALGLLAGDLVRLRSWRASTRANAAADLGSIRSQQAIPSLLRALNDGDGSEFAGCTPGPGSPCGAGS
jgi:hypothetical protein